MKVIRKKKKRKHVLALSLLFLAALAASASSLRFPTFKIDASASVLMDVKTGKVYYEHNASAALPPASMSKMMTELLVLKNVKEGRHSWNETVTASRYAANVTGAEVGLKPGESLSLRTMFEAMAIHSANDAAIALAEHISGSEQEFVKLMNETARDIGLSRQTVFGNATGLSSQDLRPFKSAASERETMMTAKDLAILTRYLIRTYPEILDVTAKTELHIPEKRMTLHTTNAMLPGEAFAYGGNDGFKTGYTQRAGYCFTGTAERDGKRFVAVVMGAPDAGKRFEDAAKMFNYAFEGGGIPVVGRWFASAE
ncbi:D-alanyl-D-alanine carboxypeptidase family protein [Paenibacillus sp. FSL M7-1455]|uniref:D-alanyl-D-alanine carboxypeptidase n=1 Tax=Paenibacillus cookii TaxID=157839 RepID=A0ABQ4LYY3_9BACL|nr:D-alanyl-D-alanine carboxypeptidase family protein [Paenibacillus cookii]KHF34377.1 D-alanyl-D-alanine carboxypeptidase DacA precursor [Paenibacillus sp. P1XP2]GIO68414.1 D-alanyl-D-alanine carboxypeptidase [Paenibacillus cookii]